MSPDAAAGPTCWRGCELADRDDWQHRLHKRHYIELAQRFDEVAPLDARRRRALDALDAACDDPDTHLAFDLEPGDVELGHNFAVLHARGAFDDRPAAEPRDLYRLWLGLPDGWALPEAFRETREFGRLFALRER